MFKRLTLARCSVLAGMLLLAGVVSGCSGIAVAGGGGPMEPATTGTINALGLWTGSSGVFCIDSASWTYTLITPTGSGGGETGPIVNTHQGTQTLPTGNQCKVFDSAFRLHFGTWRVDWAFHSCLVTVPQQMNLTIHENGSCEHA